MKAAKGHIQGSTIKLDTPLPSLEGKRVRVLVEEADVDEALSPETNQEWWDEWVDHGPQGPIADEGEPDFP